MNSNIKIQTNQVSIPNHEKFITTCCQAWERIASKAPSDSNVRLYITHNGRQFLVRVALASQQLMFSLESAAQSPFTALEEVLDGSLDRVKTWSKARRFRHV